MDKRRTLEREIVVRWRAIDVLTWMRGTAMAAASNSERGPEAAELAQSVAHLRARASYSADGSGLSSSERATRKHAGSSSSGLRAKGGEPSVSLAVSHGQGAMRAPWQGYSMGRRRRRSWRCKGARGGLTLGRAWGQPCPRCRHAAASSRPAQGRREQRKGFVRGGLDLRGPREQRKGFVSGGLDVRGPRAVAVAGPGLGQQSEGCSRTAVLACSFACSPAHSWPTRRVGPACRRA